jgi:hypothetical protein
MDSYSYIVYSYMISTLPGQHRQEFKLPPKKHKNKSINNQGI